MLICEREFEMPDPKNREYSHVEIDFYARVPVMGSIENHRLSLRKNLKTGNFEVYRHYHRTRKDEVIFKHKSLEEILNFASKEVKAIWGWDLRDVVCDHTKGRCPALG